MIKLLRQAILTLLILTGLTGFVYPLAVTGIAALCCSRAASGSLIRRGDRLVGSELIGQPFDGAQYFWPRPSAISPQPYDGRSSGGSNLGPTNSAQFDAVRARVELLRAADPGQHAADPGRPGHRVGQRPGSRDQSRGGGISGAASRRCARARPGAGTPALSCTIRAPASGEYSASPASTC